MSLLLKNMPVTETAPTDDPPLDTGQQVFSTVFSLLLSTVGTSANAISLTFFIKQRTQSLGDQILILLNSLDLMLCVLTFVDVVCRSWLEDTVFESQSFFAILDSLYFVCSESTAFATCLLSVTRAISLSFPFYSLNKTAVLYTTLLYFVCLFGKETTFVTLKILDSEIADNTHLISLCSLILFVTISIICNILTGYKLLSSSEATIETGANTKRAGVTVFILSSLFIFFNLLYIIAGVIYSSNYETIEQLDPSDHKTFMIESVLQFAIPLNSACNPIIYFMRKATMRAYVRRLFSSSGKCCVRVTPVREDCEEPAAPRNDTTSHF